MLGLALACGGEVDNRYSGAKVGDPCAPALEDDATFLGFEAQEVSIELPSPDADPSVIVCLANHFRGRTTCPYGGTSCKTSQGAIVQGQVDAQCTDRRAVKTVTWSCRCANAQGRTDDGANYCSCGDGLECEELVPPVTVSDVDDSGGYCVPSNTDYDAFSACASSCDPTYEPCP